ncbi:hypothetical protein [Longispora albida]|uniref:hypothetical protein n=1 Tax=Longispora albida TaxID=203523 RepID=UPI0003756D41|nr:hypothetical protein [Longispora albida]
MTTSTADSSDLAFAERVVELVSADPGRPVLGYYPAFGPWVSGEPRPAGPEVPETFPSGRPVPPSLARWLAFDTSMLERSGWFDGEGSFAVRPLGELAMDEFGPGWGTMYRALSPVFPECLLLPGGSDSRRVMIVTEPDEHGEYPICALDIDDLPCVELMYPGFGVYLADTAGLLGEPVRPGYSWLAADLRFRLRMLACGRRLFGGPLALTWPESPFEDTL